MYVARSDPFGKDICNIMMGTPMLMSAVLRCYYYHYYYFNTIPLLYIVVVVSALASSPNAVPAASDGLVGSQRYRYESILAPLLKALSEHGEARWDADASRAGLKPEPQYMRYMTEVYRRSPRVHRSLDSHDLAYNTLRLIKPLDKCLDQRDGE